MTTQSATAIKTAHEAQQQHNGHERRLLDRKHTGTRRTESSVLHLFCVVGRSYCVSNTRSLLHAGLFVFGQFERADVVEEQCREVAPRERLQVRIFSGSIQARVAAMMP